MFEMLVIVVLVLLTLGILTLLVRLTRTRDLVLKDQQLLNQIILEQMTHRDLILEMDETSRNLSNQVGRTNERILLMQDELSAQSNRIKHLITKIE